MTGIFRGIATPCFGTEPEALAELGVQAEAAGFDGFFIWDHILFANDGEGPDILDPWVVLALVAARTKRIRIGTMITPLSRRRPWVLARQCATLDRLSNGRMILGVGLGSPVEGDFGRFGEETDARVRAEMLDEGLEVFNGLSSGERFAFDGVHYRLKPMRFTPTPIQRPRIPIWVGGVLPATRPMDRAARWDGAVPIRFAGRQVVRPSASDIASVRDHIAAQRNTMDGYDIVVWSEMAESSAELSAQPGIIEHYRDAGASWWIETGRPTPGWWEGLQERVARGL